MHGVVQDHSPEPAGPHRCGGSITSVSARLDRRTSVRCGAGSGQHPRGVRDSIAYVAPLRGVADTSHGRSPRLGDPCRGAVQRLGSLAGISFDEESTPLGLRYRTCGDRMGRLSRLERVELSDVEYFLETELMLCSRASRDLVDSRPPRGRDLPGAVVATPQEKVAAIAVPTPATSSPCRCQVGHRRFGSHSCKGDACSGAV